MNECNCINSNGQGTLLISEIVKRARRRSCSNLVDSLMTTACEETINCSVCREFFSISECLINNHVFIHAIDVEESRERSIGGLRLWDSESQQ